MCSTGASGRKKDNFACVIENPHSVTTAKIFDQCEPVPEMYKHGALTTQYDSQCDFLNTAIPRQAISIERLATDVEKLYDSFEGEGP